MPQAPVFLMSPPAPDWTVRARANVFSQASTSSAPLGPPAIGDWLLVARAMEAAGGRVLVLPPPPHLSLTGLPYTAEAGAFTLDASGKPLLLLPNVKPPHRQAEATLLAGFAAALGWQTQAVPVLWEGQGDVIRLDQGRMVHTYGEGPSARTSKDAFAHVGARLGGRCLHLGFKADPWFHGNTFLGAFHHGRTGRTVVMVCPEALLPGSMEALKAFAPDLAFFEVAAAESVAYATNALQVRGTVVAPTGLPARVHALWKELELEVVELPLNTLFRQGGGAAVCLTNRLDGFDAANIPEHLSLSHVAGGLERMAQGLKP